MKTITLVNPSVGFNTGCIPLGLAYISAYLKEHNPDCQVRFLDANCQNIYKNFEPYTDVVAITAASQDIEKATEFALFVKSYGKNIPVILGGVHISTYPILPHPFDVGVVGEGEETMSELMNLNSLFDIEALKGVKGVCYNVCGKTELTAPRPLIADLDTIPMPDRDMTNLDYYLQVRHDIIPYHSGKVLTMITSRGCPFGCVFCSTSVHWKRKFRAFSAARVVEEMELLINKYHVEHIHIFDDLFITDKKRFEEIHRLVIAKGIHRKVGFLCLVRADMIDDKIMKMLKEMNVLIMAIGMESGSPRVLSYLKRNTVTVEKNREAIRLATKYKIPCMGSFMIGNPGETERDMLQTLAFIQEYRHNPYLNAIAYISAAFPGTEFWAYGKSKGIHVENFSKICMDIPSKIDPLRESPLLTTVPLERFFEIATMLQKESYYGNAVKHYTLFPEGVGGYMKAVGAAIVVENGNFVKAVKRINALRAERKTEIAPFIPVQGNPHYNCILDDTARKQYQPVIAQMEKYVPSMMKRKFPRATVQQAFIFNAVYSFASQLKNPKILCVGSFEDTAAASLKAIGIKVDEIDPAVNYDLETYKNLPTTKEESFDIIFSTSVIEHVENDTLFMEHMSSLLRRGGIIILTCDFNDAYKVGDRLPQTDLRFYTTRDMERLVDASGDDCACIDVPQWAGSKPDFKHGGCLYSFATLTLKKRPPTSLN